MVHARASLTAGPVLGSWTERALLKGRGTVSRFGKRWFVGPTLCPRGRQLHVQDEVHLLARRVQYLGTS